MPRLLKVELRRAVVGTMLLGVVVVTMSQVAGQPPQSDPPTTKQNGDESRDTKWLCPPYGSHMPPDKIAIAVVPDRRARYLHFDDFPATYFAVPASNVDVSFLWSIVSNGGFNERVVPENAYYVERRIVHDGYLTPLGGQIYRWTGDTLTLARIAGHPLARPPEDSVGVFHLSISQGAHLLFDLRSNPRGLLRLTAIQVRRGEPQTNEPDRVQFKIDLGRSEYGGVLFGPAPLAASQTGPTLPIWVRVGQFIEASQWRVKVLRVVHPDEEARIKGWIDLRVEPSTLATERPPAPHLPEDEDNSAEAEQR